MTALVTTCHKDVLRLASAANFATSAFPAHTISLPQAVSVSRAPRLTTLVTSCHKDGSAL